MEFIKHDTSFGDTFSGVLIATPGVKKGVLRCQVLCVEDCLDGSRAEIISELNYRDKKLHSLKFDSEVKVREQSGFKLAKEHFKNVGSRRENRITMELNKGAKEANFTDQKEHVVLFDFACWEKKQGTISVFIPSALTRLMRLVKSLEATITDYSVMKLKVGYIVDTIEFGGNKLMIDPNSLVVFLVGELTIRHSVSNNLYKISSPPFLYNKARLIDVLLEVCEEQLNYKHKEVRMNHLKVVFDRGNIFVVATWSIVIKLISDIGVITIMGKKWSCEDGPRDQTTFSIGFDVVYTGSSCSLVVIDKGNQVIKKMQLPFDARAYQYGSNFLLRIVVLIVIGYFNYILTTLQQVRSHECSYCKDNL